MRKMTPFSNRSSTRLGESSGLSKMDVNYYKIEQNLARLNGMRLLGLGLDSILGNKLIFLTNW